MIGMDELFWVVEGKLAGRPGPDLAPWDLAALRAAGIGAVLSVNDGAMCRAEEFAAEGLTYACVPLSDAAPPRPGDREVCVRALPEAYTFVRRQMAEGKAVLVHCTAGKDRTGLFLAYYLVRAWGLAADEAIAQVRRVRPIALSAEGWEEFAREILRSLA